MTTPERDSPEERLPYLGTLEQIADRVLAKRPKLKTEAAKSRNRRWSRTGERNRMKLKLPPVCCPAHYMKCLFVSRADGVSYWECPEGCWLDYRDKLDRRPHQLKRFYKWPAKPKRFDITITAEQREYLIECAWSDIRGLFPPRDSEEVWLLMMAGSILSMFGVIHA